MENMSETERLKKIVEKLRGEEGCSWDRAQTHMSLKPEVIEEAAEVCLRERDTRGMDKDKGAGKIRKRVGE